MASSMHIDEPLDGAKMIALHPKILNIAKSLWGLLENV